MGRSCLWAERCSAEAFPALCFSSFKKVPRALQGLWGRQKRICTPGTQNSMKWALESLCGQEGWFHVAGCCGRVQGCRRGQQYQSLVVAAVTTWGWFLEEEGWVQPHQDTLCTGAAAKMHLPSAESTHGGRLVPQGGPLEL